MGDIVSQRKFGLLPEGPDKGRSPLAAAQVASGFPPQMDEVAGTEVSQRMVLQMTPDVFRGIEFGGIGRQAGQHELPGALLDIAPDGAAAVDGQAIPDNQELARDLAAQVRQELDVRTTGDFGQ